ncbi:MAG: aromatic ring-hydroxylating dioxygenase subunit alpha [Myxococcota bacterium]
MSAELRSRSGDGPPPLDLAAEWRAMQRRLVAHIRSGQLSDYDPAPTTIAASVYTDPARLERERDRIFRDVPLLVGFSGELPRPGDRLLFDAAGPPILVVRGEDGRVRAFLNLCPHRGSRLVHDCTPSRRLVCPFHAWTFDLAGRLQGMALPAAFDGLDREAHGLVPVPVGEWGGMIFVRARPGAASSEASGPSAAGLRGEDAALDVVDFLGPAAPLFAALDLGTLECVASDVLPVASNWKFALDTFCEVYHVAVLHRDSLSKNLYPQVAIFDHYGLHHRYSGAGRDYEAIVDRPEDEWPAMHYQAVHYVFPNTTFAFTHALDGRTPVVSMFQLFPGAHVGESLTLARTYRRTGTDAAPADEVAAMHRTVLGIVGDEDYWIAREATRGLAAAPADLRLVLGRSETLLRRYHAELERRVAHPPD